MKDVNEMTLEELRLAFVELNDQYSAQAKDLENATNSIKEKEQEAQELRKYNNALFQRVTVKNSPAQVSESDEDSRSIEEVALEFYKGE